MPHVDDGADAASVDGSVGTHGVSVSASIALLELSPAPETLPQATAKSACADRVPKIECTERSSQVRLLIAWGSDVAQSLRSREAIAGHSGATHQPLLEMAFHARRRNRQHRRRSSRELWMTL